VGSKELNVATINAIASYTYSISKYFNLNSPIYDGNESSSIGMF